MKVSLGRLRILKLECDAIVSQRSLGFQVDSRVAKLGTLAKRQIEYEIGIDLDSGKGKKEEIIESIRKRYKVLLENPSADRKSIESNFQKEISANEEIHEIVKNERVLWGKEVEFEFIPVAIADVKDFVDKEKVISWGDMTLTVDPYLALHALIEEGFFTNQEE